ncbi:MAG: leucine-rich repeat protein, partial [Clostridia bacterium]|nr:leucine-rich repeat protein [Clostridia bacterium]
MKKLTLTVILLLVAIIGVLGLTACGGSGGPGYQPPRPQTLRVNAPTTVYQGATDGYKIEIITVMTDGSESRTETGTYSLSSEDQSKFNTVGTHTITVSFNGLTTTYQIEVIPSYEGPDGLRFTLNGDTATLVGYSNSDPVPETITLPTEYCGVPVTSTEGAIFSNASIKKIIIPEGYTTIGSNFCVYANSLVEVVIPKSVTTIGSKAFYCESYVTPALTKVTYNGSLEEWFGISFSDAGASPTYRGATLYIDGEPLTELVIPETVAFIPNYA